MSWGDGPTVNQYYLHVWMEILEWKRLTLEDPGVGLYWAHSKRYLAPYQSTHSTLDSVIRINK